jgi:hypothetical protein
VDEVLELLAQDVKKSLRKRHVTRKSRPLAEQSLSHSTATLRIGNHSTASNSKRDAIDHPQTHYASKKQKPSREMKIL